MRRKKLKFGVIGLGRIGWQFHCRSLAKHQHCKLVATADPEEERRDEAADTYHCATFQHYQDLLDLPGLDAVTIAAPTHLHKEMALAAFRRHLHVYMEKPMALDLAEAQSIARAAKRHQRLLSIYQPHRATASTQHLKKILNSGLIGQVYQVRFGRFNCVRRDDWQSLQRYGGGMLNNYGAHYLDLLLQIAGYDVRRVFCQLRRVLSLGDAEDVVRIVVETRGGTLGEIDINQASAHSPFELEVVGTRGTLVKEGEAFRLRYFSPRDLQTKELNRSLASHERQYPRDQIPLKEEVIEIDQSLAVDVYADFARAVHTGATPLVQASEAVAVMKLIAQCRESSQKILVTPA